MALDVMVDLETLGTKPGCVVGEIGLVVFDWEARKIISGYEVVLETGEQFDRLDMTSSASTVAWWEEQLAKNPETSFWQRVPALEVTQALTWVNQFLDGFRFDGMWGNGSDFDNAILRELYERAEIELPWTYKQNRCFRTLRAMYPEVPHVPSAYPHRAYYDALAEAHQCMDIIRKMKGYPDADRVL